MGELSCCVYNKNPLSHVPHEVLHVMIQYSLLPDYLLVQTSLDTLYYLSFYGGRIGEMILTTDHCISTLLNLLTLNVHEDDGLGNLLVVYPDGKQVSAVIANQPKEESAKLNTNIKTSTLLTGNSQAKPPKATPQKTTPQKTTPLVTVTSSTPIVNHQTTPINHQTTPLSTNKTTKVSSKLNTTTKPKEVTTTTIDKITFVSQW